MEQIDNEIALATRFARAATVVSLAPFQIENLLETTSTRNQTQYDQSV